MSRNGQEAGEIDLPKTFSGTNIPADADLHAAADTTILAGGCAKKFMEDELQEILPECK